MTTQVINDYSLNELKKHYFSLAGTKNFLIQSKDETYNKVQNSKNWLVKQPQYLEFLQQLQNLLLNNNTTQFSALLTAFVSDVLEKQKKINLELYTRHNLPALKIEALNNGFPESIIEGNGGALANIVSTGLRLIALSRLPHRRFIVLDESDCWIAPARVPLYMRVLGEISQSLKIQILMISHHSPDTFKDYGKVIQLTNNGGFLETETLFNNEVDDLPENYIHTISLKNFMSHQDTKLMLHPYLTCLIGTNDIGKSAVLSGLKAVSYNDSSDTYIKHGEQECSVSIEYDNDKIIFWQRFLKTTQENPQKVRYRLYEGDNDIPLHDEYSSTDVPDFVNDSLNIKLSEDIDVQIGNQKEPIFLIGNNTKPQDKAKILSLGKESIILQKMMEKLKDKTKYHKQIVKSGEVEYDAILKQLSILDGLEELLNKIELLEQQKLQIVQNNESIESLTEHIKELNTTTRIASIGKTETSIIKPIFQDTKDIEKIGEALYYNESIIGIGKVEQTIKTPTINNTIPLFEVVRQIKIANSVSLIGKIEQTSVPMPIISSHNNIEEMGNKMYEISEHIKTTQNKHSIALSKQNDIKEEFNKFIDETGHVCPLCHNHIEVADIIK